MGKIDKFLAKPVEVTIGEDNFQIKPFTVDDMSIINNIGSKDPDIRSKAIQEVVFKVFKQIDPECTKEQVKEVSIEYLEDIMNAVGKVNNLDIDDAKAKLLKEDGSKTKS